MEELGLFLKSVNKISLLAFIVVFGFLLYEINLLKTEAKRRQKPLVPKFDPNQKIQPQAGQIIQEKQVSSTSINKILIIALSLMLLIFGGVTIFSVASTNKTKAAQGGEAKVVVQTVNSKGIKIFDKQWNVATDDKIKLLKPLDGIIIGLETIPGVDIDKARIKINEPSWKIDHITTKFNTQYKVYYIEYQIAANVYKLKIDAQLHSVEDGWLGD